MATIHVIALNVGKITPEFVQMINGDSMSNAECERLGYKTATQNWGHVERLQVEGHRVADICQKQ